MSSWNILRRLLGESQVFRGATGVRLKDIEELLVGAHGKPGMTGRRPDPNGGLAVAKGRYTFDPSIFTGWEDDQGVALVRASTDQAGSNHVGAPQGSTAVKKSYGGSVSYVPGKPDTSHQRLPSAMDRYDVLMVAEMEYKRGRDGKVLVNPKTGQPEEVGVLHKVVYSPSMGDHSARRERLTSLMAGNAGPLPRRPQGEVPGTVPKPQVRKKDPNVATQDTRGNMRKDPEDGWVDPDWTPGKGK